MNRPFRAAVVILLFVLAASPAIRADVRSEEKTRIEFAGMLGRMVNLFGGKGAKEGTVSTVAVKGNRKATFNDTTGQIIDLGEEKVYELDMKKKTYKVATFAELRRRMEEAKAKAEQSAQKEQQKEQPREKAAEPAPQENNVEIDFDVKDTGQKKVVNGFDAHQVVMTITVREKGKTLEENGGLVLTADEWLVPRIPAMKEVVDFDIRYAQKLYGPMISGASAQDMAAAAALYPMMAPAIGKMRAEGVKMDGTPVMTVLTFDAVQSAEQAAAEQKESKPSASGGLGGIAGGLMRRATQKKSEGDQNQKGRTRVMSSTTEILKVVTDVSATDVAVPAGFKENK